MQSLKTVTALAAPHGAMHTWELLQSRGWQGSKRGQRPLQRRQQHKLPLAGETELEHEEHRLRRLAKLMQRRKSCKLVGGCAVASRLPLPRQPGRTAR